MRKPTLYQCVALLALSGMGARCSHPHLIPEKVQAAEAKDTTAPVKIDGCGRQPFVSEGYAYCRVLEGTLTESMGVTFIGPPVQDCDEEACVRFTLLYPDGGTSYEGVIPKGQTQAFVSWKILTRKDQVTAGDRGFWPYYVVAKWKDSNGFPVKTFFEGEIRLRVIAGKVCHGEECHVYEPLHDAPGSPDFSWRFKVGESLIQMTTGGRVNVSEGKAHGNP